MTTVTFVVNLTYKRKQQSEMHQVEKKWFTTKVDLLIVSFFSYNCFDLLEEQEFLLKFMLQISCAFCHGKYFKFSSARSIHQKYATPRQFSNEYQSSFSSNIVSGSRNTPGNSISRSVLDLSNHFATCRPGPSMSVFIWWPSACWEHRHLRCFFYRL